MIILDRPYVSKFLEDTIVELDLPVLKNEAVEGFELEDNINFLEADEFITELKEDKERLIYSNSENPINWITNNLFFTELPQKIDLFKNKVKFRQLVEDMYPDFFYKEVSFDQLEELDIAEMELPFIIKPSIGFFSLGVYKVNNASDWEKVVDKLKEEVEDMTANYPSEVINAEKFIIEENIPGEEFALDIYYNNCGQPVILNILKHIFSSGEDVSDRVYITSKDIIEDYHDLFLDFLSEIGKKANLSNFPMHIEFRMNKKGEIIPIEVNPMRFAGWCTTDLAYYAYGINVYEYFFEQKEPAWEEILKSKEDKIYSIVVADLPKDIDCSDIRGVDYNKFSSYFENSLEMRRIDYRKHGVFAFLFAETSSNNWEELEGILNSDLKEYLIF